MPQKRLKLQNSKPEQAEPPPHHYGRRTRIGLMVLLVLTIGFAGGVLFLKYQLEDLRKVVQAQAESRMGGKLVVGAVQVYGLRGLRIDGLQASLTTPPGPTLEVSAPRVYLYIDAIDLLYGQVTIDRIQLDEAAIILERPEESDWFGEDGAPQDLSGVGIPGASFRLMGQDCSLRVKGVVGDSELAVDDLAFDLSRLPDSEDLTGRVDGYLQGAPEKRFQANARFATLEDFDFRAQCEEVSAEDVNLFLPAEQHVVRSGVARPSLRVAGYPHGTLMLSVEMPFSGLSLRDQPDFIEPATGTLTALASYHVQSHTLTLTTAKAESRQLAGRLEGTVSFATAIPSFDLSLQAERVPVKDAFSLLLHEQIDQYGDFSFDLAEPYEVRVALRGTADDPKITAEAGINSGSVVFRPLDSQLPYGELRFGLVKVAWDSSEPAPLGTINITGGTLTHEALGLKVEGIAGSLVLEEGGIALDPMSAQITGNPFLGTARYDAEKHRVDFSLTGELANLEKLPLAERIEDFAVAGSANVRCNGYATQDHVMLDAAVDATQAQIGIKWWFRKPIGIGATINALNLDMVPKKSLKISGGAAVATTQLDAMLDFTYEGDKWQMKTVRLKADPLDVPTAGKCVRIPYTPSGGTGTGGFYEWEKVPGTPKSHVYRVGAAFNEIAFLPDGLDIPVTLKGATVGVDVDRTVEEEVKAHLSIAAEEAHIPSLGEKWLLPLEPEDPAWHDTHPKHPSFWTYDLSANRLHMPPWKGSNFTGTVFNNPTETGLKHFAADMEGGGTIEGAYHQQKADNIGTLEAVWDGTPATYLIQHLNFPDLLTGTMTGHVKYTVDHDDPSTLDGAGHFEIRDGRFSGDYVFNHFQDQLGDAVSSLPPALGFSLLRADVELKGDTVTTKNIVLKAQGLTVTGDGQYIVEGDMDYDLRVAISPETAAQMAMLRDYLNVEGHKLTQNDIELAFKVQGPTFNLSSKVVGLPSVGVTLVSGAAEVTNEAIKIIDAPRQILIDLVKIGGGIVGVGK